jgi:hypothetical protein
MKRTLTASDILPDTEFAAIRADRRRALIVHKRHRRLSVGPFSTWLFEDWQTLWWQVQEMLHIEKGGPGQIEDELAAYAPLIPQGNELVATILLEIEDPIRRAKTLANLGNIEQTAFIEMQGVRIYSTPETDQQRTREDGKTSAVHFVRFTFDTSQINQFRTTKTPVIAGFDHPGYSHMTIIPPAVQQVLADDFA